MCCTENKLSFIKTIWPMSGLVDLKKGMCPHLKLVGEHVMKTCIPFLSSALPTDSEPSGAKTESSARLERPSTPRSPLQTDRVQESQLQFLLLCRLASLWAAPGRHTLAYPHGGLALVCWMWTKTGRRWQLAHLLDDYPSALGHKDALVWWGGVRERRGGRAKRQWAQRKRYCWWDMQHKPLPPSSTPSLPFHCRGPAPVPPKVCSMKACFACFLPLSTMGPLSESCLHSDRRVLPLSCADRTEKSRWGLLVQRGHINTGSKDVLTGRHQIVWNSISPIQPLNLRHKHRVSGFLTLRLRLKNVPQSYPAPRWINQGNAWVACIQCSTS